VLLENRVDAPERSLRQRKDALERANYIRSWRAELKHDLHEGGVAPGIVADLIASPRPEIESMKVFALLMALPKVGRVKAQKMLQRYHISPSKTVGGLSDRQRQILVTALRAWLGGKVWLG
jgi:hypothetical protein